ncbi:plasmid pRiA4b ORF-3 family protein [Acuticoccus yangtzensis]|uniref:plasmid pRiA4b ORF-3 family protein n=1 Tax=Acuticoccus yangtzensis TaxID=1443441 RepID=UPI0009498DBC|nr:plasmid pRiA4b ORF-3 family protein [Acuticoccus yangtzensis]
MIEPVARLRIELQDIKPVIWRRVDMPVTASLRALHDVIQAVMCWEHAHLYEFRIGERISGEPDPDGAAFGRKVFAAKNARLKQLLDRGVDRFLYVYDFGDDWRHDIIVEGVRDGSADVDYPAFVDGARAAPPEDVGGPFGFLEFLDVIADPSHADRDQLLRWCGGGFDPDRLNEQRIRVDLAAVAEFRRRALLGHRTRTSR